MAHRGVHEQAPYAVVLAILTWASNTWNFFDGHHLSVGVDVEALPADRFMHALENWFIQDSVHTAEYVKARDNSRAKLMQAYNGANAEHSGVASDDFTQLPYEYTQQSETGFEGLEPPMG